MTPIRYTLLTDGSSDQALIPLIDTALAECARSSRGYAGRWADPAAFSPKPTSLSERMSAAVRAYPCDLLIVHRDAEKDSREARVAEIASAAAESALSPVPVVPVRMTEAWLLFDERAIRKAAGRPNGTAPIKLPAAPDGLPDPKKTLRELLLAAADVTGRKKKKFEKSIPTRVHRVAEYLPGIAPLRALDAFQRFELDLRAAVDDA